MTTLTMNPAEYPILQGLHQNVLEELSDTAAEVVFKPNEVIFREGQPANRFYLIQSGQVALEADHPGHANRLVQTLAAGDALGWSWLFPPFLWRFQARALSQTQAIAFNGGRLLVACEENHDFGYELMKRVAQIVIQRLQRTREFLLRSVRAASAPAILGQKVVTHHPIGLQAAVEQHPFLSGLTTPQLKVLTAHAMQVEFKADELVFKTGDPANRFYLIRQGKVALESRSAKGRVLIQMLADGAVLGWSWLFEPYRWHFDARALEPTSAIFFYGTGLREVCEEDHDLGYELLKRMTHLVIDRLQATRKQLLLTLEQ